MPLDDDFRSLGSRLWRWPTASPRNTTVVLTLPFVLAETVSELRWYRARGYGLLSREGTRAYLRERPVRVALSLGLSVLPEVVGLAARLRRRRRLRRTAG